MSSDRKTAAAILTASIAQRATQDAPIEDAPAIIAQLYAYFLKVVERTGAGERPLHEKW